MEWLESKDCRKKNIASSSLAARKNFLESYILMSEDNVSTGARSSSVTGVSRSGIKLSKMHSS
jgi:hypothetical protein